MTDARVGVSVVHVIPILTPGGAELQLCRLAEDQAASGMQVTVGCLRMSPDMRERLEVAGVRLVDRTAGTFVFARSMTRVARQASVLHAWMYHGFLMSVLLRPWTSCPHVWSVRRTRPDSSGMSGRTRLVVKFTRRLSGHFADGLVYCSDAARTAHEAFGFSTAESTVIYNSVDQPGRGPVDASAHDPRRIGFLGRWNHDKGVDVLLSAWSLIVDLPESVRLVLAGPGLSPDNDALTSSIEDLGLAPSPTLEGPLSDPTGYLATLDCLVSPSRTEGFPNVIAEAMSLAVPVIATRVGGTPEVLGECGRLVDPDRPDQLAAAIGEFVADPGSLRASAAHGPARVSLFSRQRTHDETLDFYQRLIGVDART